MAEKISMSIKKTIGILCQMTLSIGIATNVTALSFSDEEFPVSHEEVFQAYRQQKDIGIISSIVVPTVVEIPLEEEYLYDPWGFALYNVSEEIFEPNLLRMEPIIPNKATFIISSNESNGSVRFPERMMDKSGTSYADLLLPAEGQGFVSFTIQASRLVTSSGMTISLERNVALPTSVEIRAVVDGEERIVLRESRMTQTAVRFPQVTSLQWIIDLSYAQPLRISELQLLDDEAPALKRGLRFLAQPGQIYRLYLNPDQLVRPATAQSANLTIDKGVIRLSAILSKVNPLYRPADVDKDGIPDITDNCVLVENRNQDDVDKNGLGDACDDFDRDGLLNSKDNCPNNPNFDQRDEDGDGMGDVCDKEESRLTEKYPWIPWVGIGSAGVVLVVLLFLAGRSLPPQNKQDGGAAAPTL